MTMQENDVPLQVGSFILEELDGQLMIFDEDSGRIVEVNQSAALLWQLCDGNHSLSELGDLIAAAYPNAAAEIRQDIPRIVQQLVALGVLRLLPKKAS